MVYEEEDEEDESDEETDEEEEYAYEEEDEEDEQVEVIIVRSVAQRMRRQRERIAAPSQAKSCDRFPWQRKRPREPMEGDLWTGTQELVRVAGGTGCVYLLGGAFQCQVLIVNCNPASIHRRQLH